MHSNYGRMHTYGSITDPLRKAMSHEDELRVEVKTASGRVLSLIPGTQNTIVVVSDPTGMYAPGQVIEHSNLLAWASLAVEAANAVKADRKVMKVTQVPYSAQRGLPKSPGTATPNTTTTVTTTEEAPDYMKYVLYAVGTGVVVYGGYRLIKHITRSL